MTAVEPQQLIAALVTHGWIEAGRRAGLYVRLRQPGSDRQRSIVVPLDPTFGDYEVLLAEVLGELEDAAQLGVRAQAVLGGIGVDAPRLPSAEDLDEAMCSVWLHGDWRWLTRNMTTEQREAAADAVTRRTAVMDVEEGEPVQERAGLRWWRE
ncbi:hypothetical protein [Catenuloplanes japonicus]|uniref:hypothetical protein n=1 Tax=Catenuloplanes japonicus TaxID=33876 RepID=UPI000527465E|nr:hypothetical protein [Catenuloplanes japonicus]